MKIVVVLLGVVALGLAAPRKEASKALIVDVLTEIGCSTLVDLVVKAELAETLSGPGPFTVFAPINAAFADNVLDADVEILQRVLLSHVVGGSVVSTDLANDLTVDSVSGAQIRVNLYSGGPTINGAPIIAADVAADNGVIHGPTINGAPIIAADVAADNGVIHVIGSVLFPLSTDVIPATLAAAGRFSTLVTAVGIAGLEETLSGPGPFTLFAPTDEAFAALPEGVLEGLLADPVALGQVLLGHAVAGTFYALGVTPGETATLDGGTATIMFDGTGINIDNARIIQTDIPSKNGVIHVINAVI